MFPQKMISPQTFCAALFPLQNCELFDTISIAYCMFHQNWLLQCLLYCSIGSCFQQSTNQTKNEALTWKLIKTVTGTFDLFDLRTLIFDLSLIHDFFRKWSFDLWSHQTLWSEVIFDLLICGVHDLRPFCKSDLLILIFDLQSSELFDLSSQKTEPAQKYLRS